MTGPVTFACDHCAGKCHTKEEDATVWARCSSAQFDQGAGRHACNNPYNQNVDRELFQQMQKEHKTCPVQESWNIAFLFFCFSRCFSFLVHFLFFSMFFGFWSKVLFFRCFFFVFGPIFSRFFGFYCKFFVFFIFLGFYFKSFWDSIKVKQ